jgi:hypothetical protein
MGRGVDTGLESCLKIHKNLEIFTNYSEIYDNSSTILKFMENSRKSITILEKLWIILENLWTICRQLLIHKLTLQPNQINCPDHKTKDQTLFPKID